MTNLTYISTGLAVVYFGLAFISIKYIRNETLGLDDDGNVVIFLVNYFKGKLSPSLIFFSKFNLKNWDKLISICNKNIFRCFCL